ncbi:HD domain-containing protein [Candidatus Falkowbacteria bacterium]|uniref:HD domain-containing protein n=1 Tax=Candidatus Buchananbacteria bacterium CG10_big_fil_rev_8_21_14_0_10_33_19 TaxID=1974525 RepID=A0A2H0W4T3_9BACT|nr:HD domain-containing protein [Candidatus Falkowbacteria bacterium]PIS06368.1 MAG: hypothetical protein COT80_02265 [Candidatus Buchananbacteria bacterium CG10_big_fil_rev_8_21_14_0_10_33_19]
MSVLIERFIANLENVDQFNSKILTSFLLKAKVKKAKVIAESYFNNNDHGFSHSQAVWQRCQTIITQSPSLWPVAKMQMPVDTNTDNQARKVLMLASVFHDMGRFLGASFEDHEEVGADLTRKIVGGTCLEYPLYYAILYHDYFCELVDGRCMPSPVIFPISEIFRLADKTSISPSDEIKRYYQTGKRLLPGMPIFDPTISDEVRFNFANKTKNKDELTWFLSLFALQSTDFIYGDTRDAYAYWARGKYQALEMVGDLCLEEEYINGQTPVDPEEAKQVIIRFCKQNNLILFC